MAQEHCAARPELSSRQPRNPRRAAIAALATAGLLWGLGLPLGKVALRELAPAQMVALRFLVAMIAAAPFVLRQETRRLLRSPVVLLGGMLYGCAFLLQFEGLSRISITMAGLLVGTMPALIAVGAALTGERIPPTSWAGVAVATAGAALLAGAPGKGNPAIGLVLSMLALLTYLCWVLTTKRAPPARGVMALPTATLLVSGVTVVVVSTLRYGLPPTGISGAAAAALLGQGLLCTLVATAAWQFGLARVGSATAGVFLNLEPVIAASIGILLFGDVVTIAIVAGGLLILTGSTVVVWGERGADHLPPGPT